MDLILRLPNIYNIYNIYWSYKTTFDKSIVEVSNSRFVNNDKAKKPNLPSKKRIIKKEELHNFYKNWTHAYPS